MLLKLPNPCLEKLIKIKKNSKVELQNQVKIKDVFHL
jgi:hypothetical protein